MDFLFTGESGQWVALITTIVVLLVVDLFVMRNRQMSLKGAAWASVFWVAVSLLFFVVLLLTNDESAGAYLAGYLVEKSLSLDNVFVFLLVFNAFAVADQLRHRLLTYGIMAALVLRAIFIFVGAAALSAFGWVSFIFAALLIWTGYRLWKGRHNHNSEQQLVDKLVQRLPIDTNLSERKLFARTNHRWVASSSGAALIAIAFVDIIFAIDSVPAILAITSDAFIVFAANAFALLGLRPLFFLVAELVQRLYYLKAALAVLLIFIGLKLIAAEFIGKIGAEYSLPAIVLILGVGVIASLLRNKRIAGSAPSEQAPSAAAE